MEIRQIIDKIDDHQLFVPAFQREYVWKRTNVKALFSSLIYKYPTGTLLTWETTSPPELKGAKKYNPDMGAVKLILDGQQRITSILRWPRLVGQLGGLFKVYSDCHSYRQNLLG